MLYPEVYNDVIDLIVRNAEAGRLCSEAQLYKMGEALTLWRDSDLSNSTPRAKLVWKYLRSTNAEDVLEESGMTYRVFRKKFDWLKRDQSERSYWKFEDENDVSVLIKFSKYLSGSQSLEKAGNILGWSKQAVHQLMARIFGDKFSSFVSKVRSTSSGLSKKNSKDKRLQLQILKAGAALGSVEGIKALMRYGDGQIQFIQRPETLLFKSLTGKFKLLKGQKVSKGVIVIDPSKITKSAKFAIVFVNGKFYKQDDTTNPIVLSHSKINFSQTLSF